MSTENTFSIESLLSTGNLLSIVVPILVLCIIGVQAYFFIKNLLRMKAYRDVFKESTSWHIMRNFQTGFVSGIGGRGNKVFESIKDSINKYLGSNAGSVIDFQLIKDSIDRHCDSVENDVNTLTPVPLYCGLAGTMAGVIIGLSSLLYTGSISTLLSSDSGDFSAAATGVNDLLEGVAWAMGASICGIVLTTVSSLLFKTYKLKGEEGKNNFIAWLQAYLLPELPSDISQALNNMVKNLNSFNDTFAQNTSALGNALNNVNESYRIQADIIQAVRDMDVQKMATANVRVLKSLSDCTEQLEVFNEYLDGINGYTDAIHTFTTLFERESGRLHVLEEIRDFFMRHKGEIAKDMTDSDIELKDALRQVKETTAENVAELNKQMEKQAEAFKQIINEEKETFESISSEIRDKFKMQLDHIPMLEKKLGEISLIPGKIDELIRKMESSNRASQDSVKATMREVASEITSKVRVSSNGEFVPAAADILPRWMKWTILASVILIALACITNTVHNVFFSDTGRPTPTENYDDSLPMLNDSTAVDSVSVLSTDSVK